MTETLQETPKLHLHFSEYHWQFEKAAYAVCELHPEWEAHIFQIHDALIVEYNATHGKEVLLGISEALGKCKARPAKIGSRIVPSESNVCVRGGARPFRTVMQRVKRFRVVYYGDTVMPRDIGLDAFKEDLGKEKRNYKKVNGVNWTGRTRKINK